MQKVVAKNHLLGYTLGMSNTTTEEFGIWNGQIVLILEEQDGEILISTKDGDEQWVCEMSVDLMER